MLLATFVGALQNQTNRVEVTAQATPTIGSGGRREVTETEDKHVLKDFKKLHLVAFKGTNVDPAVATQWISDLEKVYEVIRCTNAQKVMCATFMLQGEADQWWRMTKPILEVGDRQITWDGFKAAFDDKYFPPCVKKKKIFEFMHLTQGSQTVMMYKRKFEELSRYAPHMVSTEEMKTRQFEKGLRVEIQKSISPMQLKTYAEVVHKSQIYEAVEKNATKDEEVEPEKKFKKSYATPTPNKDNWKKFHKRKPQGTINCKKYTEISGIPAYVLFDSGSTHSFVSSTFATKLNVVPKVLNYRLCVSTPSGGMIETKLICEGCDVEIMDRKLTADLILLEMKDFDVILGMDWLAAYHASVLCFEKRVIVRPVKEPEFEFSGMMIGTLPSVIILVMQARKLLR
ncbi:uncharacterized protein LOC122649528 [Telopea speciosissima]|uniref:uncharacterized protein LOC122649528 n=1 Tax=Telopea speciosissima TaxID=54955 RepID=UPI001CC7C28F|nr:uncharacterized protein LOC122649528 [Telopea speciosissima]